MRKSLNYNLRLPERLAQRNDPADIDDLTYDVEAIDKELARQKKMDEDLDSLKASRAELNAHKVAAVLDHPDNCVTDAKIGNRTMQGYTGLLSAVLDYVATQIKALKGTAKWNDAPATTLADAKQSMDDYTAHKANKANPHAVTKAQVGLGSVPDVATNDQVPTYTAATTLAALVSGEKLSVAMGKLAKGVTDLIAHLANRANPHAVTKVQVGLGSVSNDAQVKRSEMGVANGVATLDANGTVPAAQLPAYVDDVLEYATKAGFPATGETGKIYVSLNDNLTWRWSGTAYVEISKSLALGETPATAYAGDKGKAVADGLATTKTEVAANTAARHTHANKSVLDGITAALMEDWSDAIQTLTIGTVQSGAPPAAAIVKLGGGAARLDMTLPKGDKGDKGEAGSQGQVGPIGPQGPDGAKGDTGAAGPNLVSATTTTSGFTNGHVLYNNNGKVGAQALPTALKNPTALTISLNGASQGAYDGSTAKTVNITPAGIGASVVKTYDCATTVAGWAAQADGSYKQTVTATGVTAASVLSSAIVGVNDGSLTLAQKQAIAEALGYVNELVPGANNITFVCYDSKPVVDMTVQVTEVR